MKNAFIKCILRSIRNSLGRFFSILSIIALGVGFFTGLKSTKPSMVDTATSYVSEQNMFDYRIMSTIGYTSNEIKEINELKGVKKAEGSYYADFLSLFKGKDIVIRAHLMTDKLNQPYVVTGRLPEKEDECVIDDEYFAEYGDLIGTKIIIADTNKENTKKQLKYKEYTVTGTVYSPLYLNHQKDTSVLGNGKVNAYIFIKERGFDFEYYNEMYLTYENKYNAFTKIYDKKMEEKVDKLEQNICDIVRVRYDDAIEEANKKISDAEDGLANFPEITEQMLQADLYPGGKKNPQYKELLKAKKKKEEIERKIEDAKKELGEYKEPEVYAFERKTNLGYSSFENDSEIVDGIAKIFPIFFFLIAALICSTTMSRMVSEERTLIGTFYSIGYSKNSILAKYMIYSGSAAIIGCVAGYFAGSFLFPVAIWKAYEMMYCLPAIHCTIQIPLLILSIAVSLICSVGVTFFACKKILKEQPAVLLRSVAPLAGKKILLERIKFIWKHMKFLHKITLRNIFRFKKRMCMMILGIAGCTALVVTGVGIHDSIANIANDQFDEIQKYDMFVIFSEDAKQKVVDNMPEAVEASVFLKQSSVEVICKDKTYKSMNLMVTNEEKYLDFFTLSDTKGTVEYPGKGEVVIDRKIADLTGVSIGDNIQFVDSDKYKIQLKVSAIVNNYVYHYANISAETYEVYFKKDYVPNSMFLDIESGKDPHAVSTRLQEIDGVASVGIMQETRDSVEDVMTSLNAIVYLIIFCAALLAFIVLFNLGNINISERMREIATIKVLGFHANETSAYVFRENVILSFMGIIVGIPLGVLLHKYIMNQINIDIVTFKVQIFPISYAISVIIVIGFTIIVNAFMRIKIDKIDMTESLKSNE